MQITIKKVSSEKEANSSLVFGVFEDDGFSPSLDAYDKKLKGYIKKIIKQGLFKAKAGTIFPIIHSDLGNAAIVLVGLGPKDKWDARKCQEAIFTAFKYLNNTESTRVICYLTELPLPKQSLEFLVRVVTESIYKTNYRFDQFKSNKEPETLIKEVVLSLTDEKNKKKAEKALEESIAISKSVSYTKDLGNLPSNICTPTYLRDQAKKLARDYKLKITILGKGEMIKAGMGAILGVAKGSREEPFLVALEYYGAKNKKQAPIALVGKGITFDTGGNSIKPSDSMIGMKYDMCGSATVLGAIKAAAELKLPINIVGVVALVENMPGGNAYKPDDILTSLSGKTIEVLSTDAEGRLILADALTYCERYNPDVVIDIATLTGAIVIALGNHATGLLANNDKLAQDLLHAGIESNDKAWQLPLWDEYQEQIRSPFADMANLGGRSAGSITAACFLSRFAEKFHWAHLDVAGTAANMTGTSERRATGRPVPLLVRYLINRANG